MSKQILVDAVAEKAGFTKTDANKAVDAIGPAIAAIVSSGGTVDLRGLGRFKPKHMAERTGRNPATGETIQIAARDTIGFKPTKGV